VIRSSKHYFTRFINRGKLGDLQELLQEYRRIIQIVLDDLINCDLAPKYYDIKSLKDETWLSQRMLRSLSGQAIGIIKSLRFKKRRVDCSNVNMSLNSINYDVQENDGHFDEFIRIKCLGNKKFIKIPIKYYKTFHKWNDRGKRISGIEVSDKWVKINFQMEAPIPRHNGRVIGADQGYKTIVTLSDGQKTDEDIIPILEKLRRKKKGSKAFHKAQDERRNLINRAMNRLSMNGVKELRFEEIKRLRRKKKTKHIKNSKNKVTQERLLHWTYPLIQRKMEDLCLMNGVRFIKQPSFYRFQRCSSCGLVLKRNRRGKKYSCSCGIEIDADLNAAKNHEADLPKIPSFLLGSGLNKTGFYWLESGLFNPEGGSLQSSLTKNGCG
jgi:transposase